MAAVATSAGELDADWSCARSTRGGCRSSPATSSAPCPRSRRWWATSGSPTAHALPDLPHEVVLHGDPMLVVRTGGRAPDGAAAWTVHGRGRLAEDLARARSPGTGSTSASGSSYGSTGRRATSSSAWGGSPLGVLWQGRATTRRRLGPATPVPGVYAAGAHATPGAGLPFVGLSAALVAQAIGPA